MHSRKSRRRYTITRAWHVLCSYGRRCSSSRENTQQIQGPIQERQHANKGRFILIRLRDWEAPDFKECDLLEVYDPNEIKQLQKIPSINMNAINRCIESIGCSTGTSSEKCTGEDIEFSADHVEDYGPGIPDSAISVTADTDDLVDFEDI